MELSTLKEPKLVVALDVGSTYSGYAWEWRTDFLNNRSNVQFNTNWGAGALQLHKTTTCLLLDKNRRIDSFGHVAETRYRNHCDEAGGDPNQLHGKWLFFKRFKLLLYGKGFKDDLLVEDYVGQKLPIMVVMSLFIGALKDHFIKNQLEDKGHKKDLAETLWVVTVPAIWSDRAKKFMREAAKQSGIDRRHLLLAHEPESAALYCMNLPAEQRQSMNDFGEKGDKFLTVDLGGGTVDILAIEVLDDGNVQELCAGTGEKVGGDDVNIAFQRTCRDTIEGWQNMTDRDKEEILAMEKDFENIKIQLGSNITGQDENFVLRFPRGLKDGSVSINANVENSRYFKIDKERLTVDTKLVLEKLFRDTVKLVLKSIEQILIQDEVSVVKTIVLVGGFSESPFVVGEIKSWLQINYPDIKVVVPTSPFRAVLTGAVLFGHDPFIFQSRISKATFGVEIDELFDPSKHDAAKRWTNDEDGKDYCADVFSVHVKKNQSVKLKQKQPSWTYNPMFKRQTEVDVRIYSSSESDPKYTTDDGCKRIGTIHIGLSNIDTSTSRNVLVQMIYGGTELSVIATEEDTGKEYPVEIKFESFS